MFDFSASLNAFVPASLKSFPVDLMNGSVDCWLMSFVLFLSIFTTQIEFGECCV